MRRSGLLPIAALAVAASAAFAQIDSLPIRVQNGSVIFSSSGEAFIGFSVTGLPYSAHLVLEHSQTLSRWNSRYAAVADNVSIP